MERELHLVKLLQGQRGAAAIWFVLCLPVLLGFAALAVDLARLNITKVELQNAADAAALAGARSLATAGGSPYNWEAAGSAALAVARANRANAVQIHDAVIETGYWNLGNPSLGLRSLSTPGAGDVPAVSVTVALSGTQNGGPLKLFFAPLLGIAESCVQAGATCMIAPPAGGTGIFPFVISKKMLDNYWNTAANAPVVDSHGVAPAIRLGSTYIINKVSVLSGQWTTFQSSEKDPSVQYVVGLMRTGNTISLSIGQDTYIQPGAKASVYSEIPVGQDVAMFVVDDVVTDSFQPVYAIAAFHITGYNQGAKYIEGHFTSNVPTGTTNPGDGVGVPYYGAYTPPLLVQ